MAPTTPDLAAVPPPGASATPPSRLQRFRPWLRRLSLLGRYLFMIFLALIFALPIVYMVVASLKPYDQLIRDQASFRAFLPVGDISLGNYQWLFGYLPVPRFLANSILVSALTVLGSLAVNSMAAFALSRLRWRGQGLLIALIIAAIIIPFEAISIPLLLIVNNLPWIGAGGLVTGWFNSYQVQIVPFLADAFSVFLFYQYFKALPGELFDVARIDGASWPQIFLWIVVPLSGPVYATVAILRFLAMWNQYLWPSMVIQTDEYRTLMVGFGYLYGADGPSMAYLTVALIPVLILFFAFQRAFVKSISASSQGG
ncbi:MAG: carbohydrate ABC transporter permease [Chloroflexota bacterium]|nr:MAG: carbohydrate ABC transporter permease [Chloroflexota bacterium]